MDEIEVTIHDDGSVTLTQDGNSVHMTAARSWKLATALKNIEEDYCLGRNR